MSLQRNRTHYPPPNLTFKLELVNVLQVSPGTSLSTNPSGKEKQLNTVVTDSKGKDFNHTLINIYND